MSYPTRLVISRAGTSYVNQTFHKSLHKKTKSHAYVCFAKINNQSDKATKFEIIQDSDNNRFSIQYIQENKQPLVLYVATKDGIWSCVHGKNPTPTISSTSNHSSIVDFFPKFKSNQTKKKNTIENDKKEEKNSENYVKMDAKSAPVITKNFVLFYHGIFSQWFFSDMVIDNVKYVTCEQYMMAEKARLFGDKEALKSIMKTADPKKCKALGRKVQNFKPDVWDKHRELIVYKGNYHKFTQNKLLKNEILSEKYDGKLFAEASPYDKIWGIGLGKTNKKAEIKDEWKGSNLLGKAITKVRDHILREMNASVVAENNNDLNSNVIQ